MPAQRLDKIAYLTCKGTAQVGALQALSGLRRPGAAGALRVLSMVAKVQACEHPDKACHGHPAEPEYTYKCLFLCELLGGEEMLSHEICEIAWFDPAELPEMCPHRASPEYVALACRHHADPTLPTEWD